MQLCSTSRYYMNISNLAYIKLSSNVLDPLNNDHLKCVVQYSFQMVIKVYIKQVDNL